MLDFYLDHIASILSQVQKVVHSGIVMLGILDVVRLALLLRS